MAENITRNNMFIPIYNVLIQLYEIDHTANIALKSVLYGIDYVIAHFNIFGVYNLTYKLTNIFPRQLIEPDGQKLVFQGFVNFADVITY